MVMDFIIGLYSVYMYIVVGGVQFCPVILESCSSRRGLLGVNRDWNCWIRALVLSLLSIPTYIGGIPLESYFEIFRRENSFLEVNDVCVHGPHQLSSLGFPPGIYYVLFSIHFTSCHT